MSSNAVKVFKHFSELPLEMQAIIIAEMQPEDRCRFSGSCYLSLVEAKRSKQFIYGLRLNANFDEDYGVKELEINVEFEKWMVTNNYGFQMWFGEEFSEKLMKYKRLENYEKWRTELDDSEDLVQNAVEYFTEKLQKFQRFIKKLMVIGPLFKSELKNHDFGVKRLDKLEELVVDDGADIMQFLSKIHHPLNNLTYWGNMELANCEQVYEVKHTLDMPDVSFSYLQLRRLSADKIGIHIGELTEENIFCFIEAWRNGELKDSFESCSWKLGLRNFEMQFLCLRLHVEYLGLKIQHFEIKHNKDADKKAFLSYYPDMDKPELLFSTQ